MDHAAARKLRLAFELYGAGEEMMRQKLRREKPGATDPEIEAAIIAWLQDRPGAEFGDVAGVPREWR